MAQRLSVLSIVLDPSPGIRMEDAGLSLREDRETQHPADSGSRPGAAAERLGATLARTGARQDCVQRGSGGATLGTHDAYVAEHGA